MDSFKINFNVVGMAYVRV